MLMDSPSERNRKELEYTKLRGVESQLVIVISWQYARARRQQMEWRQNTTMAPIKMEGIHPCGFMKHSYNM